MKYKYLLLIIIAANATALCSGIIEPDGALYAYIAKQMAQHNDFINLFNNGDWLDKPHFPFWVTALSFKVFGVTSFAYKLPAFLFWLLGIYYLYKLGKAIYNKQVANVAVLLYTTALQGVIGLFDVRAEHYLTALTIAAMYYLYKLYTGEKLQDVILAALFSAGAVMTKGIFFLITIVSGFGILILIKKEWKQLLNWRWYLYIILTFVFILPELYCLYVQFDLHPEKIVYGRTHVSGLRFFFWDSQFGRFFNTGPIKGSGDVFFFFHTVLWAFLPWCLVLYAAILNLFISKKWRANQQQWIVVGSAAITFLIFSLSKFQLPHYIIILFPQFALLVADFLVNNTTTKATRYIAIIQRILFITGFLAVCFLSYFYGLPKSVFVIGFATVFSLFILLYSRNASLNSVLQLGIGFSILVTLVLNLFFYPSFLQYQSGTAAANWFNKTVHSENLSIYRMENFSLKFYADSKVTVTDSFPARLQNGTVLPYYFMTKKSADSLTQTGFSITQMQQFKNFHISQLTYSFLDKNTRSLFLNTYVIVKLNTRVAGSVIQY